MKLQKDTNALSDVVGTIVLLGITVALFSTLCYSVLSYPFTPSAPAATIVGTRDDNSIILEHRGGEALLLDTKVIISIQDSSPLSPIVGDYPDVDTNGDHRWGIGEGFVYTDDDMVGKRVHISVVDMESRSVIMIGTFNP